jgi:hypothetical protein
MLQDSVSSFSWCYSNEVYVTPAGHSVVLRWVRVRLGKQLQNHWEFEATPIDFNVEESWKVRVPEHTRCGHRFALRIGNCSPWRCPDCERALATKRQRERRHRDDKPVSCAFCGTATLGRRSRAYCSSSCRQRAYRARAIAQRMNGVRNGVRASSAE